MKDFKNHLSHATLIVVEHMKVNPEYRKLITDFGESIDRGEYFQKCLDGIYSEIPSRKEALLSHVDGME